MYLKCDITHETPRIRKSCPCEDAEGKHLHRKNGMKAFGGEEFSLFSLN